jgi:histone-lysine N-methyltransferase SETD2
LTQLIADKEKKSGSYKENKLEALSDEKVAKIKKFSKVCRLSTTSFPDRAELRKGIHRESCAEIGKIGSQAPTAILLDDAGNAFRSRHAELP